ncbi:hypothetical protein [Dyella koreensis]|uniref:Uncharacterized protein n=1 Tax=Dyella koreensis TaxID=311235 RepID=A0ABW8K428_9GAMM
MKAWPSVSSMVKVWLATTFLASLAFVLALRYQPPDEETMFNNLGGQIALAMIEVAAPAFIGLLAFLLIGALIKRHALNRATDRSHH